jgi:hypothetical protein
VSVGVSVGVGVGGICIVILFEHGPFIGSILTSVDASAIVKFLPAINSALVNMI